MMEFKSIEEFKAWQAKGIAAEKGRCGVARKVETTIEPLTYDECMDYLVSWHDSYSTLGALLDLQFRMDESEWLRLLGACWSWCDNIAHHQDELWDSPLADRDDPVFEMMTDEARALFDSLPDEIVIYRGCYAANKWGMSWTLKRDIAERFPFLNRYRKQCQPLLVKARIAKARITTLILDRGEFEVITRGRPKHISTSHIRQMPDMGNTAA